MQNIIINCENSKLPVMGPMALVINKEFPGAVTHLVDLTLIGVQGRLSMVQTLFIDASQCTDDVEVKSLSSSQRIVARAGSQGYYPIMSDRTMKFEVRTASTAKIGINFCNFPVAPGTW